MLAGVLVVLLAIIGATHCFYLPDHGPVSYCSPEHEGDGKCQSKVEVFVNRLSSVHSLLAFDYGRFDLCMPEHLQYPRENLGQVVFGDRISNSPYIFTFGKDEKCAFLCKKEYPRSDASAMEQLTFLIERIDTNYMHYWIIDNMPVTWCVDVDSKRSKHMASFGRQCLTGFPLGCHVTSGGYAEDACKIYETLKQPGSVYLFNHVDIVITYNPGPKDSNAARIISAKILPRSIAHPTAAGNAVDCWNPKLPALDLKVIENSVQSSLEVKYSYSVEFKERHDLHWASRWDYILGSISDTSIHWLSIVNSLLVVVFLSILIAVVMLRALRRDIAKYNDPYSADDGASFGWKSLSHDVFRPPQHTMILSVTVGFGCQLTLVLLGTVAIACIGMLSPASRGALATFLLVLFVCTGGASGYISSKIYKMYGGANRKMNVLLSGTFIPGLVFGIMFVLNLVLWANGSSSAMPFTTLVLLVFLWCCVSEPLTFLGAYFGFQQPAIENPVRSNSALRDLSHQNLASYTRCLAGGLLPFSVSFIPTFFILTSIWLTQIYYLFGFLLIVLLLFIITSAQTAMLLCYLQLSTGDYRWGWRSFFSSGSVGVYFFIYICYYYLVTLRIDDWTSTVLYFGYSIILTLLLVTAAGSIGWVACIIFVRKIYSCIKMD